MKSSELQLQELIEFSDGLINLKGRRLVLHSIHAFAQFRKDLIANVGDEHARRIITRFGFIWGKVDAAAISAGSSCVKSSDTSRDRVFATISATIACRAV